MTGMDWDTYVRRRAGDSTPQTAIAKKVGVSQKTVSRWQHGDLPSPAQAAAVAIAYGGNVLEAFVAAGLITAEQAQMNTPQEIDLAAVGNLDLAQEVSRRLTDSEQVTARVVEPTSESKAAARRRPRRARSGNVKRSG